MAGRLLLSQVEPGFTLPAYERLAAPPPPGLIAARLEANSTPGDIVADLHGRGGWTARVAIDRQRKAFSLETSPLTRLLAEIVLRPPDLRHLDAAFGGLGASPRGESSLKLSIGELYATKCATCGRASTIEELTWSASSGAANLASEARDPAGSSAPGEGDATAPGPGHVDAAAPSEAIPVRKQYPCTVCRDQQGGGELRSAAPDEADLRRDALARLDEVLGILEKHDVVCAAVNNARDIVADPHFRERTLVELTGSEALGRVLMPGPVLHLRGYDGPVYDGVPVIGQHSRSVLADWVGLDEDAFDALAADGIVAQAG